MSSDPAAILVRRLSQSALLQPGQLKELTATLQAQFPDPRALAQELVRRGWVTIYQVQQVALGKGAELTLGPYVLLEKLGEGGMGQVFKAKHARLGRVVALKVVRPDLVTDQEVVQRFFREIEVISRISHPNIVHAYDAGPIGKALMLAMEFVDGVDLDKLVKRDGPLPVRQACDYIRQAACGLQHAHEKALVHRDIKPSNLLVAKGQGPQAPGVVKILDMGLARLIQPAPSSRTRNLTVLGGTAWTMGTPDYLAPEQAIEFHKADIRADIYSLGCTLFFLLTGRPPFEGTLPEKLMKHQQVEPEPLEKVRPDAPPELGPVLARLLAKLPAERYQTPAEVAAALEEVLAALPAPAADSGGMKQGSSEELRAVDTASGNMVIELVDDGASVMDARLPVLPPVRPKGRKRLLAGVIVGVFALVLAALGAMSLLTSGPSETTRSSGATRPAPTRSTAPVTTAPEKPPTGLQYAYYEGNFDKLPQFDKLTPVKTGTVSHFTLKERKRDENFAFVFTGQLVIDKPGKYSFWIKTDDGGRLFIGDKKLIDDDGPHGAREKGGTIDLKTGKHPIKAHFYQGTGLFAFDVFWSGPDTLGKQPITEAVLLLP
jgi:serine/threonine-protein kinase